MNERRRHQPLADTGENRRDREAGQSPASNTPNPGERSRQPSRLRPRADTGITLRSARERERLRRRRIARRNRNLQYAILALCVVATLLLGWQLAREESSSPASDSSTSEQVAQMTAEDRSIVVAAMTNADPTPLFASYRSLHLYLPVPNQSLTEIAFHQASGEKALHLESLLPDADMTKAAENHGTGRAPSETEDAPGPDLLAGEVLRMWRSNRTGPPDTAVDVGARPGTYVFAPVTGKVVAVRPYELYGQHDDYEVHIQPNGWDDVDVVLIHVDSVCVQEGDEVIGGCTKIAEIRRLSDKVVPQIAAYTADDGDHVHVQLNKVEVPGKLEMVGGS